MSARTLFSGGTVLTMNDRREVRRAELLIRGGRIEAILAPGAEVRADRVVDCAGCLLVPGLVQPRTRLVHSLFRGQADGLSATEWIGQRLLLLEAGHTAASVAVSAKLGAAELLAGGTTCILDVGSGHHTGEVFAACEKLGLRAAIGSGLMDRSRSIPAPLRATAEQALQRAADLADRWHGAADGRLRYAYTPRSLSLASEALLRGAQRAAAERGCLLQIPVAEHMESAHAARERYGRSGLALLQSIGYGGPSTSIAHGVCLASDEQRILRESGAALVHCPTAALRLAAGAARVPELMNAGVRVGVAADSPAASGHLDGLAELRLTLLVQRMRRGVGALTSEQALWMGTRGGAQILGLDHEIGSLEPNKRADFSIVDLGEVHTQPATDPYDRLLFSVGRGDLREVYVDGVQRAKRGRVRGFVKRRLLERAEAELSRILQTVS